MPLSRPVGLAIFALIRSRHFFRPYASSLLKSYRSKSFFTHSSHDFLGRPFFLFRDISTSITSRIWELMSRYAWHDTHDMIIPPQATLNYHILNIQNNTHPILKNISRHPINQSHLKHHPDHTTLHPTKLASSATVSSHVSQQYNKTCLTQHW